MGRILWIILPLANGRRFIPTHVGRIVSRRVRVRDFPVHPHARGADYLFPPRLLQRRRFIPTHVGRIQSSAPCSLSAPRFIPTHVGRMGRFCQRVRSWSRFIPTHVGRMSCAETGTPLPCGSSPRTWGGCGPETIGPASHDRFIPTHVGRMPSPQISLCRPPVHPHARGADGEARSAADSIEPVHPHARGADDALGDRALVTIRFIPTHVGRMPFLPFPPFSFPWFIPTHVGRIRSISRILSSSAGSSPRTWGGSINLHFVRTAQLGSSPRTWGGWLVGIIPSAPPRGSSPRTWGGWLRPVHRMYDVFGSSPRTWGGCKLLAEPVSLGCRFIPTHVGRMWLVFYGPDGKERFIPTHVGRIGREDEERGKRGGSSPRTWGGYFPKCSYGWILMNCKPSKSMMVRRGFPYVSMEKPCSLLVE